ncbi:MAG: glycosyltransferase family 4 protein [Microcystis aeruginosa S11-01]|jgi:glycosyltransferase involved in cell wall biosynthesis|nr:glycosyltransferase family 4 protein [Microcystis aeruginosa S11-05]NCR48659.1 glycosyltransferase family 4 protein [Microcystis aeruginosa S11-01]
MKIVIPIVFYRKGGVERVIISLIPSLLEYVEQIIIVLPRNDIEYFKSLMPDSDKLIYEDFAFYPQSFETKLIYFYGLLANFYKTLRLTSIYRLFFRRIELLRIEARINQIIKRYQADHCLYGMTNRISPPNVKVTLSGIIYDVFWQFAPLTYSESYQEPYNEVLKEWLDKADLLFTISQKTKDDVLKVFPNATYASKLKPVPLAGFVEQSNPKSDLVKSELVTFYFPSSFGIYKDHLTLLKAAIKLAKQGLKFQIVFIGKETDNLVSGNLQLSQQSKTQEYQDYLKECTRVYRENQEIFESHIKGLGYQDYETLQFYYQTCSCVVFPSKYEGFGLAIAEAILQGIPVIASDLEVFQEQVELYNCPERVQFYPRGDAESLANCLEQFILNPIPRLLPEDIPNKINLWTWEDVAKKYVELLKENAGY